MEILPFEFDLHFNDCVDIFDSNCPKYFLESERAEFLEWLSQKGEPYWVIQLDDKTIGCGGIYFAEEHTKSNAEFPNEVGFAWGMVHSDYHKMGYGKALLSYRINYLISNYPERPIVLRTSQLTDKFFEKMGFDLIRNEKDGWGSGMDKVIMVYKA